MKIAGAIAAVCIFIGVLGYVIQHRSAPPAPAAVPVVTPSSSATPAVESNPAGTQERVSVSSAVVEGLALYKPAPQYPQMARIAHISGDVILKVTIDRTGQVKEVVATSGHPILIQSAIDAVKKWKYRPYVVNGEAVEVESTVKVQYHM